MNKFLIVIGALLFLAVVQSIPEIGNDYQKGSGTDPTEIQASYDVDLHDVTLSVAEFKSTTVYSPPEVFNYRYVRHVNIPDIDSGPYRWCDDTYYNYAGLHESLIVLGIYRPDNYQRDEVNI